MTPGVTPTPGATPTPTPEAKTLKMGSIFPLSGPAAPWGVPMDDATHWAADRINERGGLKVGNDIYMIKVISCDNQASASGSAECEAELIYDEGIKFIVGPLVGHEAAMPICRDEKVFLAHFDFGTPVTPEDPYFITATASTEVHHWNFLDELLNLHPEIETMATLNGESPGGHDAADSIESWCDAHGVDLVVNEFFDQYTPDFYPQLTKIVSKNPDVVNLSTNAPGSQGLMIKQIRELGYDGLLFAPATHPGVPEQCGWEAMEGMVTGNLQWESPLVPAAMKALYQDYNERFPEMGGWFDYSQHFSFGTVNLYATAIEKADSIDVDAVRAAMDDPDFRFDYFGYESYLYGQESYGIRSRGMVMWPFAVVENGMHVQKGFVTLEAP
jgi:branched-chain amino acid transport system substrate-binding protein